MPPARLPSASEAAIEGAIRDLLLTAGFYPVKTDAALVVRGGRGRSHIPAGFPDMTFLYPLPGSRLCLAAIVETKTASGKLRQSQVERHAELRTLHGLHPHILRDVRETVALIQEARRLSRILKDSCQEI